MALTNFFVRTFDPHGIGYEFEAFDERNSMQSIIRARH
jgi:hypothetical protein